MESDPIARIASRLSQTQVEVMTSKMYRWEVTAYRRTADVLIKLGLLAEGADFELFETYKFTAAGRKVREHLLGIKYGKLEEWSWDNEA